MLEARKQNKEGDAEDKKKYGNTSLKIVLLGLSPKNATLTYIFPIQYFPTNHFNLFNN